MVALTQKSIQATVVLGEGDFGQAGQNQIVLPILRSTVDINLAGGSAMGVMDMSIYGMTLSQMNTLSTLGMVITQQRRNSITVDVGDEGSTLATIFQGQIINAYPDMNGMPDVPFRIYAGAGLLEALAPVKPISIRGGAEVAAILSGLAIQMKLRFENNGVNVRMPNQYYSGSARDQAQAIVADAGIEWNAGVNGVLAIWNAGQSRGGTVIEVSKTTGMVTYPSYTSKGIMVRTKFNPLMGLGSRIKVQTDLKLYPADGEFVINGLNHHLACQVPNGPWFSDIQASPPGSGAYFTP